VDIYVHGIDAALAAPDARAMLAHLTTALDRIAIA
jgi:hypothetical protein